MLSVKITHFCHHGKKITINEMLAKEGVTDLPFGVLGFGDFKALVTNIF